MSRPLIAFLVFNSFTTFVVSYFYNYYLSFNKNEIISQNDRLEFIVHKVKDLEHCVLFLQQSIEEIEEKIDQKNNKVIESNTALNSKLEEFININYELYNDD